MYHDFTMSQYDEILKNKGNMYQFKDGKFYAESYASLYGSESEKIINEIMPKVIHGEKELRSALKVLEKHRKEILELANKGIKNVVKMF